ncbi:MAG: ECF-type sigma factor [Pseudomonadales bacterium]
MQDNDHITGLLHAWRGGDNNAFNDLAEAVYDDVVRIARRLFARESEGHTLEATAVANEALLRVAAADITWQDRTHFLAVVASTVRRVLVDHARQRQRDKRGGAAVAVTFATEHGAESDNADLIDLHEGLLNLAKIEARKARILELHYFGGLNYAEIAEVESLSEATVHRELRFSRAWLKSHLGGQE